MDSVLFCVVLLPHAIELKQEPSLLCSEIPVSEADLGIECVCQLIKIEEASLLRRPSFDSVLCCCPVAPDCPAVVFALSLRLL